jgi:putative glutamine amidotransferase
MIRIAIPASYRQSNDEYWEGAPLSQVGQAYVDSVIRAGAVPMVLPVTDNLAVIRSMLDVVDGVVLTGGEDLDPALYGEVQGEHTKDICHMRDAFDLLLFQEARARKMPILGICRGMHLINVAMGGTLDQHIPDHIQNNHRREVSHQVFVEGGSILERAMGQEAWVNSFHHQAIKDLGAGLTVSAKSPDRVIEAVESAHEDDGFMLAVQWHPEELSGRDHKMGRLFSFFVEYCKKSAGA